MRRRRARRGRRDALREAAARPDVPRSARWAWVATPLRAAHAFLLLALFCFAWGGLFSAASSRWDQLTIAAALAATSVLLVGLARRSAGSPSSPATQAD